MNLRALVGNSSLLQEDKDLWFSILEGMNDEQVKILEDFVENKEDNLKELTGNLKAKRMALENLDEKALDEIIKNEN